MLLLTIILILWPYLFFAGYALSMSLDGNGGIPLMIFAIFYIIASAILYQRYFRLAKASQLESEILAKYNMLIKLIPAVADFLLYGTILFGILDMMMDIANGAMVCVPVHLIFIIFLTPYTLARLFALVATLRVSRYLLEEYSWKKDSNLLHSRVWLHSILHLLPVAHIISNIIVYKTVKTIIPDIKD